MCSKFSLNFVVKKKLYDALFKWLYCTFLCTWHVQNIPFTLYYTIIITLKILKTRKIFYLYFNTILLVRF